MDASPKLSTLFFGTPDFSLPSLNSAIRHSRVVAVITQPDKERGRGQKLSPCPVKELAVHHHLPVFSPRSLRKTSEELDRLNSFLDTHPVDLGIVVAYGNLLPDTFLNKPSLGCINVHASLLPKWRGAAPIQRALEAGDTENGVCLQKMVMALDAGDVLLEKKAPLSGTESALDLWALYSAWGGELCDELLAQVERTRHLPMGVPQNSQLVTLAPKIDKNEARYQLSWGATETHNRVRAFRAWPQVRVHLKAADAGPLEIKLLSTRLVDEKLDEKINEKVIATPFAEPPAGEIRAQDNRVYLGCRDGALELDEVQPPNKGATPAWSYFQNLFHKFGPTLHCE